jgi:hypothetical protein
MDETQDDKYILSLICFARKDFSIFFIERKGRQEGLFV